MKPANKKLLALLLAAMIPAGLLAGCGEEETTSSGSSAASTTGSSESTGSGETAEDTELYEFTLLGNLKTELEEVDELYFAAVEEATNTKINIELPPASSYTERLQMMIASTEYADVKRCNGHMPKSEKHQMSHFM